MAYRWARRTSPAARRACATVVVHSAHESRTQVVVVDPTVCTHAWRMASGHSNRQGFGGLWVLAGGFGGLWVLAGGATERGSGGDHAGVLTGGRRGCRQPERLQWKARNKATPTTIPAAAVDDDTRGGGERRGGARRGPKAPSARSRASPHGSSPWATGATWVAKLLRWRQQRPAAPHLDHEHPVR